MDIGEASTDFSVNRPKTLAAIMLGVTLFLALLGGLPTLFPETFAFLPSLKVDTDPENMLPDDDPVRVFDDRMKKKMSLYDMVVVGVVNEEDPNGAYNPQSLARVYELSQFAKTLRWDKEDGSGKAGVVQQDMIAPSMVDNVESGGEGVVRFEWLMPQPPETQEEADAVWRRARNLPFLKGTMVPEDKKAVALYLPITSKDLSAKIYGRLQEKIAEFEGPEEYHITGLPVAEDVFGVQMFKQMAISAPLAMLIIFILMWIFFHKAALVVSAMFDAMIATICTMGLLIATGNTVHIMSSMIPIFIVPIAVLDDVHVLSEFFDRYQRTRDRKATLKSVMSELYVPMLYTSLTTSVGFASLALAPIPPVQVFGLFVAFGVMVAWLCSVMFVPAFIMMLPESVLEGYGATHDEEETEAATLLGRWLQRTGRFTYRYGKVILAIVVAIVGISIYGIKLIQVNDNPTKWFTESHPIRVADRVMNKHLSGTYMAYLALRPPEEVQEQGEQEKPEEPSEKATPKQEEGEPSLPAGMEGGAGKEPGLPSGLGGGGEKEEQPGLPAGLGGEAPEPAAEEPEEPAEPVRKQVFKRPEVLRWIGKLEESLSENPDIEVGKTNSLTDIVRTVHRELMVGVEREGRTITREEAFRVPDTVPAVAQCLMQYQNSHRPQDLWHFTTPNYREGTIWFQLTSGDNKDMLGVVHAVDDFVEENPPPTELQHDWFGLTYINVVWQQKMVGGMLKAFLGSFLAVFLMMTLLYRSALWGILCMIPLTVTVGFIYGVIGLVGKDYDMPVAVLSSLSLGLAVDYAIHFLTRTRMLYVKIGSWEETAGPVFGEPARAITRNAIVVALGFLPLLAASLVPYQTVGIFIASILAVAGLATLLILPSLITLLEKRLFPRTRKCCLTCNCITCILSGVAAVALIAVNVQQFLEVGWTVLTWVSIPVIIVLAGGCAWMSRREKCTNETFVSEEQEGENDETA